MIPRGKDGRASGLYLAETLVGTGIAALSEDCFLKTEAGNDLLKIPFQEKEALQDPEIREALPKLKETLVYLLYFAEKDPALFFSLPAPLKTGTGESSGAYTGMRTFLLLSEGKFSLKRGEESVRVFLSEEMNAAPEAEAFVSAFVSCLFRFSREDALPLIFAEGEQGAEAKVNPSESEMNPEESEVSLTENDAGQEKEPAFNIPTGTRETLTELNEMFAALEGQSADTEEKTYQPFTYEKGQVIEGPGYRMLVPDDCVYRLQEEGHDFILWRPNEDNPEEWEAASLVLFPGDCLKKDREEEAHVLFLEEAKTAAVLFEMPLASAVQRFVLEFRAYAPDKKEDYLRTAVRLFMHIEIREA